MKTMKTETTTAAPTVGQQHLVLPVLRDPDEAPRDGSMILASVGWPWLVPAVWDEDANEWSVVTVEACPLKTGAINRYWQNESELPRNLIGWIPWPDLPIGYQSF